jgi:hypothetical protein
MKNLLRAGAALALVLITMFATLAFRQQEESFENFEVQFATKGSQLPAVEYSDGRTDKEFKSSSTISCEERMKIINKVSQEGWELMSTGSAGSVLTYTFKRKRS